MLNKTRRKHKNMSRLIQIYREILQELQNEKKLARPLNQKNLKEGGCQNIRNHGHNDK